MHSIFVLLLFVVCLQCLHVTSAHFTHSRVDVISKGHGTSCVYIIYVYVLALTAILLSFKIRRKTDDKNINNKTMFMCARANINNVKIHVQCARWGIGNAKTQAQLLPFAFF